MSLASIQAAITAERLRQDNKFGEQNHPDGTGALSYVLERDKARQGCENAFQRGAGTWMHVLIEEVFEAFAEEDPAKLRAELIQVAAVAVAWIEAIDRRTTEEQPAETPEAQGETFCTFGVTSAPGSGCLLPAGHEPANRHIVTPGDTDDEDDGS